MGALMPTVPVSNRAVALFTLCAQEEQLRNMIAPVMLTPTEERAFSSHLAGAWLVLQNRLHKEAQALNVTYDGLLTAYAIAQRCKRAYLCLPGLEVRA